MATANQKKNTRQKVQNYRDRMRASGLRPVQIWVPDTRTSGFAKSAHAQSRAVAASTLAHDDQAFINDIAEFE